MKINPYLVCVIGGFLFLLAIGIILFANLTAIDHLDSMHQMHIGPNGGHYWHNGIFSLGFTVMAIGFF